MANWRRQPRHSKETCTRYKRKIAKSATCGELHKMNNYATITEESNSCYNGTDSKWHSVKATPRVLLTRKLNTKNLIFSFFYSILFHSSSSSSSCITQNYRVYTNILYIKMTAIVLGILLYWSRATWKLQSMSCGGNTQGNLFPICHLCILHV